MREFRGPFRFFVWYTVILRSAGPAVLTLLLVYGVMHSLFLPYSEATSENPERWWPWSFPGWPGGS